MAYRKVQKKRLSCQLDRLSFLENSLRDQDLGSPDRFSADISMNVRNIDGYTNPNQILTNSQEVNLSNTYWVNDLPAKSRYTSVFSKTSPQPSVTNAHIHPDELHHAVDRVTTWSSSEQVKIIPHQNNNEPTSWVNKPKVNNVSPPTNYSANLRDRASSSSDDGSDASNQDVIEAFNSSLIVGARDKGVANHGITVYREDSFGQLKKVKSLPEISLLGTAADQEQLFCGGVPMILITDESDFSSDWRGNVTDSSDSNMPARARSSTVTKRPNKNSSRFLNGYPSKVSLDHSFGPPLRSSHSSENSKNIIHARKRLTGVVRSASSVGYQLVRQEHDRTNPINRSQSFVSKPCNDPRQHEKLIGIQGIRSARKPHNNNHQTIDPPSFQVSSQYSKLLPARSLPSLKDSQDSSPSHHRVPRTPMRSKSNIHSKVNN